MKARTLAFWIFVAAAAFILWHSSTARAQVPIYTRPSGVITNSPITGGNITSTGQFLATDGTLTTNTGGYAFTSGGPSLYKAGANTLGVTNGTAASAVSALGLFTNSAGQIAWTSDANDPTASADVVLVRSGANIMGSGTAALTFQGQSAAAGGSLTIKGGPGSSTTGGSVSITGGTATSGVGSNVTVTAGSGAGGTNGGGNVNLVPGSAVSTGTPGEVQINSARGLFDTCWVQYPPYATNIPVTGTSYTFFLANRAYRVVAASIINSSTSTVPTVNVTKDTGTTAPGAGSSVLTGAMTFNATANTRVTGTPNATVATTNLAAGDRLATVWGGTIGAITGAVVCVTLVPI